MTDVGQNPSSESITSGDIEMAEPSQPVVEQTTRRIIVDANDTSVEVTLSKKPQVPQESTKKGKVIAFIAKAHREILTAYKLEEYESNLSLGDQIHNNLFTAYNVLRQRYNKTGGRLESKISDTDYSVTWLGQVKSLPRERVHKIVEDRAPKIGIPFGKFEPKDKDNWYGIAGHIFNFLSGFNLRIKEIRLGHNTMPIGKEQGREKAVQLSQYGIYGCHHILCEGVTFPPEKRASMVQSLGPLTLLICYLKNR